MNTLEFYQQAYTYDTGNNLTNLFLVRVVSLFCFVLGGWIQPQYEHACLDNHKHSIVWCYFCPKVICYWA
jgi:hypothetical protein